MDGQARRYSKEYVATPCSGQVVPRWETGLGRTDLEHIVLSGFL